MNTRLSTLEQMDRTEWHRTLWTEVLEGDKDSLVAVKVYSQRIQHRLLGYDGPTRGEFTLLANCEERNDKYVPKDIAIKTFGRKTAVEGNPITRRIRHDFE